MLMAADKLPIPWNVILVSALSPQKDRIVEADEAIAMHWQKIMAS